MTDSPSRCHYSEPFAPDWREVGTFSGIRFRVRELTYRESLRLDSCEPDSAHRDYWWLECVQAWGVSDIAWRPISRAEGEGLPASVAAALIQEVAKPVPFQRAQGGTGDSPATPSA